MRDNRHPAVAPCAAAGPEAGPPCAGDDL